MKELKELYNKQKQAFLQYSKANQEFKKLFIDEAVSKAKSAFLSYYNLEEGDVITLTEGLLNNGNDKSIKNLCFINIGEVRGKLFFKDSQLIEIATSYFNRNLPFVYAMFENKNKIAVNSQNISSYEMHDINSFIDSMILSMFVNQCFLYVQNDELTVMSSVKEYDKFTGFVKDILKK
jgi:hypothetical protein